MTHAELIDKLGGPAEVAKALNLKEPNRVYNWREREIAWRFRPRIAKLAKRAKVDLPEGFLA